MSYEPTNWQNGDTITAEKLNKIEGGIEDNAGYWIPLTFTALSFDKYSLAVPEAKRAEVYPVLCDSEVKINGFEILSTNGDTIGFVETVSIVAVNTAASTQIRTVEGRLEKLGVSPNPGKVILTPVGYEWFNATVIYDELVIDLTPTSLDFSGTTNVTDDELENAFFNKQKVKFSLYGTYFDATEVNANNNPPSFGATVPYFDSMVTNSWLLIRVYTGPSGIYGADVFTLTPLSM